MALPDVGNWRLRYVQLKADNCTWESVWQEAASGAWYTEDIPKNEWTAYGITKESVCAYMNRSGTTYTQANIDAAMQCQFGLPAGTCKKSTKFKIAGITLEPWMIISGISGTLYLLTRK